ncbi:RsfA family transcriptional regulator [Alicyclobacillus tolerans]|uniref:RsfA family transcriptional regulator n=1 Tax=Alicyclobacillus tolerans TaxID=90970 RepID=UPI001F25DA6B|nr:RsfA family transcriptional regulator [Alicyclobacillus tolerans]MCF8563871.1 RsfA family transcriptional regulator [Alicyclobacillus tolerans]
MEKWATRSDAWTPDDDVRLAEIVLQHIRTGSTQLRAFEEAANELGRTAAACGYRWNGVVRKNHREDIERAKRERKSAQRVSAASSSGSVSRSEENFVTTTMTSSDSMKEVIRFLQSYDEQYQKLRRQVDQLEEERRGLTEKLAVLETKLAQIPQDGSSSVTPEQLEQDSKTLFAIMERARKLLESDGARTRTAE